MRIEGTVSAKGQLIIKGSLTGSLSGETIVIGAEGTVYANIKAGSVTIGGSYEGNLTALTELVILPTGRCEGEVVCKDLVVEPGGFLNAKVRHLKSETRENPGPSMRPLENPLSGKKKSEAASQPEDDKKNEEKKEKTPSSADAEPEKAKEKENDNQSKK